MGRCHICSEPFHSHPDICDPELLEYLKEEAFKNCQEEHETEQEREGD